MTAAPLWSKGRDSIDAELMAFMAGEDVALDRHLFLHDIRATRAHAAGLARIGALAPDEAERLDAELQALAEDFAAGRFTLDQRYEDGHSAIEARLTERLGETGRRVHLGRSRNDQVLTALRLWMIDSLRQIAASAVNAGQACLAVARTHEHTPMPGYTHLQRAVVSSVGLWMASFAEGFADSAELARSTAEWMNASPLGTAAGYGVNLALDREGVARDLGFARLQINPMHAQASRGAYEVAALSAAWQSAQIVRRLGWDLTLFSASEFAFIHLDDGCSTGSSIMPNKRNPDVAELLRGSAAIVSGAMMEVINAVSLPSGYHRDLQVTKGPLIRGLLSVEQSLRIAARAVSGATLNVERMREALDAGMFATDRAVELAAGGMPFRDAYREVGANLDALEAISPEESIAARVSPGACADLRLDEIGERLGAIGGYR